MSVTAQRDGGGEAGRERPRPVLFLHIPKTAGTSFILTLQNVFGDNRVRRIHTVDAGTQQVIDELVRTELDQISVLTGHLPMHMVEPWLDRFQPFTVLREPIARVLSLYRFLKLSTPQELQRLQLPANFSLGDFLGSRHPELYGQVNNGVVRMLSGDVGLTDPGFPEFRDMNVVPQALNHALANLERMEFGLAEEMARTLAMVQQRWSIPYALPELRENTTEPDRAGDDVNEIHQIIARNTLDLALYERAKAIFRARVTATRVASASVAVNPLAVFDPPANAAVSVGDIPGRQGFHRFEEAGLAWLGSDQAVEIRFVSQPDLIRLRLHVYTILDNYPLADVALTVNELPVRFTVSALKSRWFHLETDHFETVAGINRIAIRPPVFIPVRELTPGTLDKRSLGLALADVVMGP